MNNLNLLRSLLAAGDVGEVEEALASFIGQHAERCSWTPLGDRRNNRGTVEVSTDPGRALIERLTNGIDAVLEHEYRRHSGNPFCTSPKEAAQAWLAVPSEGLSGMTPAERRQLGKRVTIRLLPGTERDSRIVVVEDEGTGLMPDEMPTTILSLNESNKLEKRHLAGAYGQGGSSTYAVSKYSLVASRSDSGPVGFTVVKFEEPPPDAPKVGRYVYLVLDGEVIQASPDETDFSRGTIVRHFGYDLSAYNSPLGPNSIYGLLNQVLFDPVMPVWLDNQIHDYRRIIKGSRNALNGAVDDGDDSRGPTLSHHVPMFYVGLGEYGRIGIEYWVLEPPGPKNKRPTASYVDPNRPIILTYNGQNQAEISVGLIRREADLPFLGYRLICHVDCNKLSFAALRALFVSNREAVRKGAVLEAIHAEVLRVLQSDDELKRLNTEAREQSRKAHDEEAAQNMRREVARLLRLQGVNVTETVGGSGTGNENGHPRPPRSPRPPIQPIPPSDPPTFVRIVWEEDEPIPFYPGQRRYIRVETDANSTLHNPKEPLRSSFNFVVDSERVELRGSTPLQGGRMRLILDCAEATEEGESGILRVELARPGYSTLADQRDLEIVPAPPPKPGKSTLQVPPFEWHPVDGPSDPTWPSLGWPDRTDEVSYEAQMSDGVLNIYYSTVFPKYVQRRRSFENRSEDQAVSFTRRYEIWLAVHALLHHNDESRADASSDSSVSVELSEARDRAERRRVGTLSVLVAAQEAAGEITVD